MVRTDTALSQAEIDILKAFEGCKLISYEMKCVGGNDAWSTVRFHFENGDIDIISSIQRIPEDDKGSTDEFSVLRVANTSPEKPIVPDMPGETVIKPVGKTVTSLSIANDTICYYSNDIQDSEITYTQAILLDFGSGYLCIDKEAWFSEILFIKNGFDKEKLIHDDSSSLEIDPEEDPISRMEYSCKLISL
jgi:hypothetical protein